jgi:ubiquinone/menaquinone biosynthesis C-methylase UbiE
MTERPTDDDAWRAWRRLLGALLGDVRHSEVRSRRVLDVGTGTGVVALLAAELGHDVTGVDTPSRSLAEAGARATAVGLAVEWRTVDIEALPPDLVAFDVVIARHVLGRLSDPARALASWRDAARAGGLVVVIDRAAHTAPWPFDLAQRAAERLAYPRAARARLPLAAQRDLGQVTALMRGAGLERVRVRPTPEIDRVERAHRSLLARLGDPWRCYLATGRTPIVTAM